MTKEKLLAGELNINAVSHDDIAAFIAEHAPGFTAPEGATKADILNALCEHFTGQDSVAVGPGEVPEPVQTDPPDNGKPEVPEQKRAPEKDKLPPYLERRRAQIEASQRTLPQQVGPGTVGESPRAAANNRNAGEESDGKL